MSNKINESNESGGNHMGVGFFLALREDRTADIPREEEMLDSEQCVFYASIYLFRWAVTWNTRQAEQLEEYEGGEKGSVTSTLPLLKLYTGTDRQAAIWRSRLAGWQTK